jgi:hypothetical protein
MAALVFIAFDLSILAFMRDRPLKGGRIVDHQININSRAADTLSLPVSRPDVVQITCRTKARAAELRASPRAHRRHAPRARDYTGAREVWSVPTVRRTALEPGKFRYTLPRRLSNRRGNGTANLRALD